MYIFYAIFQARPTSLEVYYFEYNFICGVHRHKRHKYDKTFSFTQKSELGWWLYTLKSSGVWAPSLSACCPHPKGQMADHHVCFPMSCSHPIDHPSVTWTLPAAKEFGKFSVYSEQPCASMELLSISKPILGQLPNSTTEGITKEYRI